MPWDFLLIFFLLAVVVPWRGWARMQRLVALPSVASRDRIQLYLTSIATQWVITIVVAWRALARGLAFAELGLKSTPLIQLLLVGFSGAALFGAAHWVNLRRVGKSTNPAVERIRMLGTKIFPHNNRELALFGLLSLTAGVCEEFLYRGFVCGALLHVHTPTWAVLFISSVLFGLAHAYQGRGGVVGTLLLGTVFGLTRILYDSLIPVILWHSAVDIVAGFAGRRYLTENK
jgi:membrane protease YdiL (CAAX protease family)